MSAKDTCGVPDLLMFLMLFSQTVLTTDLTKTSVMKCNVLEVINIPPSSSLHSSPPVKMSRTGQGQLKDPSPWDGTSSFFTEPHMWNTYFISRDFQPTPPRSKIRVCCQISVSNVAVVLG